MGLKDLINKLRKQKLDQDIAAAEAANVLPAPTPSTTVTPQAYLNRTVAAVKKVNDKVETKADKSFESIKDLTSLTTLAEIFAKLEAGKYYTIKIPASPEIANNGWNGQTVLAKCITKPDANSATIGAFQAFPGEYYTMHFTIDVAAKTMTTAYMPMYIGAPTGASHAATKQYVDDAIPKIEKTYTIPATYEYKVYTVSRKLTGDYDVPADWEIVSAVTAGTSIGSGYDASAVMVYNEAGYTNIKDGFLDETNYLSVANRDYLHAKFVLVMKNGRRILRVTQQTNDGNWSITVLARRVITPAQQISLHTMTSSTVTKELTLQFDDGTTEVIKVG